MNNRFTIKDAVGLLLMVVIIILLGLKMVQDDRQWKRFARVDQQLSEQTRYLTQMRNLLSEGVAIRANGSRGGETAAQAGDPFRRLREAQQLPNYSTGDWMIESFGQAVPKVNELTGQDVYGRVIYSRVMESLATYDLGTRELVPLLARDWDVADDGLSVTFHLRRNVTFSNGDPFTADDVVYTFEINRNEEIVDGRNIEYYRRLASCEKIDDYTVRFTFTDVFYENLQRAAGLLIHSKAFLSQYSDRQVREDPALLLGTGPYRLPDPTRYAPGDQIQLLRNEHYWGEPGPWDRIVYKIIEQEATQEIAFRNGEIDIFGPTPEQHLTMLRDQPLLDRTQHFVFEQVRSGYSYIGWNQVRAGNPTIYADKRVRQALTMLINRQRIADEIFLGFSSVASGPFHHLGPQHNPSIEPWPFDPTRAAALLAEAGFTRTGNGPMMTPAGRPFQIDMVYPAGSETYQKLMLAVKDDLARSGIDLQLLPQRWVLLLKTLNERDFDAIALGWGAGGIESDIEQMFHSRTIAEGDNRNSYANPELDRIIEQAHVTLDDEQRMALWQQAHAILHEDQPYTFLFRSMSRVWLDKRIHNVHEIPVLGLNHVSTWPVPIEWFVPAPMQKYGTRAAD